ncbi:MAG: hypothetical protein H3C43_05755, partial [Leptonema sp. (in: Bacteria)]|nr:hypothetical protein [Leptonema sp. (in: bacteria)]
MNITERITRTQLPASQKLYVTGSRPDIQVPIREINLTDTYHSSGAKTPNDPFIVYDTS